MKRISSAFIAAFVCLLVIAGVQEHLFAQSVLAGYQYVIVVPPDYGSDGRDIYGVASELTRQLRNDRSWIVINSFDELRGDRTKALRTLSITIDHPSAGERKSYLTLNFFDSSNRFLQRIDGSGGSLWTSADSNLRKALNDAVRRLRQIRATYNPSVVPETLQRIDHAERLKIDEASVRAYVEQNAKSLSEIEGIWTDSEGQYRLGVMKKQDSAVPNRFVAVVLETRHPLWDPGMVKAVFDATSIPGAFSAKYRLGDHSEVGFTSTLEGATLTLPIPPDASGKQTNMVMIRAFPIGAGAAPTRSGAAPTTSPKTLGSGTGFVVASDLLVTNYHVIDGGTAWQAFFPSSKQTYNLDVVVSDKANDLAVMRLIRNGGEPQVQPLKVVGSETARLGDEVYTVGFPLGDLLGSDHKLATGVLSGMSGIDDDPRMFQITVPVQPGNSGGPIVNGKGEVVGVLASTLSVEYLYRAQKHIPQNVNFAIKSDYLSLLVRQAKGDLTFAIAPKGSRADQIEVIRKAVARITSLQ